MSRRRARVRETITEAEWERGRSKQIQQLIHHGLETYINYNKTISQAYHFMKCKQSKQATNTLKCSSDK
ncbi:hypothetical protein TRIATDRAFT_260119 [Trichoderma atroviride IMI 206040]|uniref:Uncharacterized protein n=1 Tax=Hypocrea atroviridis (strain ATCC 20476 / IMI 206040) TaxID=452589 RepID=G9P9X9_HYPAI|nr:uncharacterized protein TRIATDRAFT_260119 [Trichoderma atroviride IMI 206040]EHK40450.1 hypothetical protein TRIATDRAFT_260119 [Trichoderma atroviride IMI 206040]